MLVKTFEPRLMEKNKMIQIKLAATQNAPWYLIFAYSSSDKPADHELSDLSRIGLQNVHGLEQATLETQVANKAIQWTAAAGPNWIRLSYCHK